MPTTTTIQGLPLPVGTDAPNVPADLSSLAQGIETRLNMRFSTTGDRDSKVTAPVEGMMCVITGTRQYQVYSNSAWRTFYSQGTASEARYGHVASYETSTRPTGINPGTVGYNRITRRLEGFDSTSNWRQVGAFAVGYGNYLRVGGGGTSVGAGSSQDMVTAVVITTEPDERVLLFGNAQWQLPAGTSVNASANFPVTVDTTLRVTPPGAGGGAGTGDTEISRFKETALVFDNYPSAGVTCCSHYWDCAAIGTYTFRIRLHPVNGTVLNLGGQLTVLPLKATQGF